MGNVKILIVEDDSNVARLVQTVLTQNGYGVAGIVVSGEEAVDVALEAGPELILMNIRLGGEIDGITAYEQIAVSTPIPVVFMSGYTDADCIARAMRNKPAGYLRKPFRVSQLLQTVGEALAEVSSAS